MRLNSRVRDLERRISETSADDLIAEFEDQARWMMLWCAAKEDVRAGGAGLCDFEAVIDGCGAAAAALVHDLLALTGMSAERWRADFADRVDAVSPEEREALFAYFKRAELRTSARGMARGDDRACLFPRRTRGQ